MNDQVNSQPRSDAGEGFRRAWRRQDRLRQADPLGGRARLYPEAPELQPGLQLFALHAADGTPIMVTDSREAAVANA